MEKIEGIIEEIEIKGKGRRRLKIGPWFSYFGQIEVQQFDYVVAEWEKDGKYKTIKKIEVREPPAEVKEIGRVRLIVRQACVKAACTACPWDEGIRGEKHRQEILNLAAELENWIYRGDK